MRFNILFLVPTIVALASYAQGHYDEFDARDLVDELSTRETHSLLRRSEIMEELAEISTRDLIDELSSRLEARGNIISGPKKVHNCFVCNKEFSTYAEASACHKTINEDPALRKKIEDAGRDLKRKGKARR
ncbi:hypothetical protein DFP72DRAFT_1082473 [Ephemerocybe angulata]|uniref:C2H2-type domain-containing protein n=1 Tax=Ephemerocybe angulata TaxID=980116 RepID=A0A8H6HAB4_9AGAR|nr:hypothetical protein DFP72DRAFT_1082473 [Tulosesus angulatus]